MAGYFAVTATFDQAAYSAIYEAGFDVVVQLDLTHCAGCETVDGDGTTVMQKGIELDVEIQKGRLNAATYATLYANRAQQHAAVKELVEKIEAWGGFPKLTSQHAKVEFPNIGTDIFDAGSPPNEVYNAVQACTAANADDFDELDEWTRGEFGMFKMEGYGSWSRVGSRDDKPRTAKH